MNRIITNKSKKGLILVLIITMSILLISCQQESKSEVVAEINDLKITQDEFYEYLLQQNGQEVLEALILEKMLDLEIAEKNIQISQDLIDAEYAEMVGFYGGEEQLNNALAQYGYTSEQILKNIELNLSIEALMKPYIDIQEDEILSYFTENKASFATKERIKASHILVDSEELALEILEKLQSGEEFDVMAKLHSKDLSNANMGGDLGYFERGVMVAPFEEAAFSLNVGEISQPVETSFGYHIIKLFDKQPASDGDLESAREDIVSALTDTKMSEAYPKWYEDMQNKYKVTNHLFGN